MTAPTFSHEARFDKVGSLIGRDGYREEWTAMVRELDALASTVLADHLFHGTSAASAASMIRVGFEATDVTTEDDLDEGTYWARPLVAAFYAEDRIESTDDENLELVLLAVSMDVLEDTGRFAPDLMSLECPIETRIAMETGAVNDLYDRLIDEGVAPWRASLEATHSIACLAPVGPDMDEVVVLRSLADVRSFVAAVEAENARSPAV